YLGPRIAFRKGFETALRLSACPQQTNSKAGREGWRGTVRSYPGESGNHGNRQGAAGGRRKRPPECRGRAESCERRGPWPCWNTAYWIRNRFRFGDPAADHFALSKNLLPGRT